MMRRFPGLPLLFDSRAASHAGARRGLDASSNESARRVRFGVLIVLLLAIWLLLLGWASQVPYDAAFQPALRSRFSGSEFHVVMGAGVEDGRRLGINAVGTDHIALQSLPFAESVDADAFPILRYRWEDFPRTLELSFVFRRADEPDDVHSVTLPPAGVYPGYFDLSNIPEWSGRIVEVGFSEFPTAQLVPADIAFRPFSLIEAELWSPSWRGSLAALGTDWSAYRPWALMSVSALGPDAPWPHKPTPVLVLTIGLTASLLIAALVLMRNAAWLGSTLCVAIAGGWLALDLRWIGELADRHVLTRELYAGKSWRERAAIEPDTALIAAAARVRDVLAREPAGVHVIVAASSVYDILRLNYHLLPANVAPVGVLLQPQTRRAMQPALLIVYDDASWVFDASRRALRWSDVEYAADLLLDEGELRIFRLHGVAP